MENEKLVKLIMEFFSLKGRTNYAKLDVITWAKQLQRFNLEKVEQAFSQAIRRPGFMDIGEILAILEPKEPEAMAIIAWQKLLKYAAAGGQVPDQEKKEPAFLILQILGGMSKLQLCSNEFLLSQMKKNFIDIYTTREDLIRYGDQLPGPAAEKIKKLMGGEFGRSAIENR